MKDFDIFGSILNAEDDGILEDGTYDKDDDELLEMSDEEFAEMVNFANGLSLGNVEEKSDFEEDMVNFANGLSLGNVEEKSDSEEDMVNFANGLSLGNVEEKSDFEEDMVNFANGLSLENGEEGVAGTDAHMDIPFLTDSEEIVMKAIWDLGDRSRLFFINDIIEKKYKKKWKPQTVSTFLKKITEKGFIEPHRVGRYINYDIRISLSDYRKFLLSHQLKFWYDSNVELFKDDLSEICDK